MVYFHLISNLSECNFKIIFIFTVPISDEDPNTTNNTIQPFASTYAPGQGFNYNLNYKPT